MPSVVGGDTREGRRLTQRMRKEHGETSDYLLQVNTGEIIISGVFYLNAMPQLPKVGEDSGAVQFNTIQVDADPVSCPEEYHAEAEVDSA